MKLFLILFIFSFSLQLIGQDVEVPMSNEQIIEGAIVNTEYQFNLELVVSKNQKSIYIIQSNKSSNIVGITGIETHIGQYDYNQVIIDPNTDSFVYLDAKSMTGVTSVMPMLESNEKIEMKLLPMEDDKILGKKCIVLSFTKKNFNYKIWLTKEEDKSITEASLNDLNILMNIEQLGNLSDLKINNQTWMKIIVQNTATNKKTTFELTKYYTSIDESIMTFDYNFITPKWD